MPSSAGIEAWRVISDICVILKQILTLCAPPMRVDSPKVPKSVGQGDSVWKSRDQGGHKGCHNWLKSTPAHQHTSSTRFFWSSPDRSLSCSAALWLNQSCFETPTTRAGHFRYFKVLIIIIMIFFAFFIKLIAYFCTSPISKAIPSQINRIKNAKNHLLLLKKFKNTESAQLCPPQRHDKKLLACKFEFVGRF